MDILRAVEEYEDRAEDASIEDARSQALDHYYGRPYGDEVEGRSHVVMRDVADTIEWIKPSLMKIFASTDEVVRFDPVGPEDEQAAEQETEYCNHVLMQKSNGFLVLHDWFHDALLQKNGYVMVRAVKKTRSDRERFEGLSDDEFALLAQSQEAKLDEHSERVQMLETAAGPIEVKTHDCVIRQVVEYTCLEVVNIPPERVRLDPSWPHMALRECPFVEVVEELSISDLRREGYKVDDDINDQDRLSHDDEKEWRRDVEGQDEQDDEAKGSSRRVKVRRVWILHDADDDGIAERHRMVIVGRTVLEDEEDDIVPVAAITPGRVPHEHNGMSVDDWVHDLQRIRTVLVRGYLDNLYLSMHGRHAIDVTRVNLDDMLVTRPGGVVRVQGNPGDAVTPLLTANNGQSILQGIEYVDTVRENRTGVTRYNQGLDANTLNKTAQGVSQIMTASQQRIELIARVFAETGVRELMLLLHAMSIQHGRKAEMVKLRGKWVPIDPRGWRTRQDVTVAVGIGTGNKVEQLQHLMMILQQQQQGMQVGIATPVNVYNTLKRLTQAAGFKQAEEFWTDPSQQPPAQPGPPPEVAVKQMELQADAQKFQAEQQAEQQRMEMRAEVDKQREEMQARQKLLESQAAMQLEQQKAAMQAQQAELDRQAEMARAQLQASVQLEIARMREENGRVMEEMRQQAARPDDSLGELRQTLAMLAEAMSKPRQITFDGMQ